MHSRKDRGEPPSIFYKEAFMLFFNFQAYELLFLVPFCTRQLNISGYLGSSLSLNSSLRNSLLFKDCMLGKNQNFLWILSLITMVFLQLSTSFGFSLKIIPIYCNLLFSCAFSRFNCELLNLQSTKVPFILLLFFIELCLAFIKLQNIFIRPKINCCLYSGKSLDLLWFIEYRKDIIIISFCQIYMNNLQDNLLAGKGKKQSKQYKKKFDQCENRVKALKYKNNELQRQNDNELEGGDIRLAIKEQTAFIKKQIENIREMIEGLSKEYSDPASRNKIKELWNLAAKEFERNKRLMEEFVNRASYSRSFVQRQSEKANRKTKTEFQNQNYKVNKHNKNDNQDDRQVSLLQSQDLLSEITFQQKMLAQKNALLKELQQKNYKINEMMNEMGRMVGEQQRDMINAMQDNTLVAKHNVEESNQQLQKAGTYQKKSKKKYICLVVTIIVVMLIAAGMVYLFVIK